MMRYFRFQLHQLLTNRKNLAVIGIALVALICQFVFFPPNQVPPELPTSTVLTRDRDKNVAFINEPHGPHTAMWVPVTRQLVKIENRMLTAKAAAFAGLCAGNFGLSGFCTKKCRQS